MNLPTAKEINPFDDLDGQCAERHFLGKTLEETEALFRESSLTYQEDLMFMGPVAFRFYVHAAISYIRGEAANGDSDIISCFAGILRIRLDHEADELVAIAAPLASLCAFVLENYNRFDVMAEIYGDLRPKYRALEQTFLQLGSPSPESKC